MKMIISLSITLWTIPGLLFAQPERIRKVDSLFSEMTRKDLFSGAVLIANDQKVLLAKGYGYADRERKIKNTPDTRFELSSGSKIFTGTAITLLAQEGKLKFTDTVGKYIPGLPKGNIVTIHQLLTHSAGYDNFYKAAGFSYRNVKNCMDVMPWMRTLPLVYNPGDSCIYSTGNAIILGAIVEKITGMSFQEYVAKTFLDPLGMENTTFAPRWTLDSIRPDYATGYNKSEGTDPAPIPYDYERGFIPLSAGGACSSVNDLYRFDRAVFSDRILNKKYLGLMTTAYTTPVWENSHFGYIWILDNNNTSCIGHAGNSSGWHTWNYYYPSKKTTIIILTNFGFVDIFALAAKIDQILFTEK
jgi:CubicO group peptidase (beta-lactamase class C family)